MKIQKCTICGKPFFQDPKTTTDYTVDFDPTACPQCNENARQNSVLPIVGNKRFNLTSHEQR